MPALVVLVSLLLGACGARESQARQGADTPAAAARASWSGGDGCEVALEFSPRPASDRAIFAYDTAAPLDFRSEVDAEGDSVVRHRVSFASPKGGRATGLMFVPRGAGPFAGVIAMHGMPGNARNVAAPSERFARRGAVVIAIDAPGSRRPGQPLDFTPRDSADQVQLMVDLQRAVDVLVSRADVDPRRIAYVGWSYGGAMGALFAGIERRLATSVLAVGDGGLVSHFTGPDDRPGFLGQIPCERRQRWARAMLPIEPIRFVHLARPSSILFQSGRTDQLVPEPDGRALQSAAGPSHRATWYDAGHGLGDVAFEETLAWLRERVGMR